MKGRFTTAVEACLMSSQPCQTLSLSAYDVSAERGFLPDQDPLAACAYDPSLDELSKELPKYLVAGRLRDYVNKTPQILRSDEHAFNQEAVRCAFRTFSFAGHGFVWEDPENPADHIPASLAVPWHRLSRQCGRPPVLSYASYALDNWRLLDPTGPVELGNIVLFQNFLGGVDEEWFILVHVDIEAKAGRALFGMVQAMEGARLDRMDVVITHLWEVVTALEEMCRTLRRMPEWCDPYIYYHRVRPYIHGWKDNPVLPQGLIYQGVEEYQGQPQKFRGETGAQSSIIPALDAGLGIIHDKDPLTRYLIEMREYMPPKHRSFIEALEAQHDEHVRPLLYGYVTDHKRNTPELWAAFSGCVEMVAGFREIHIDYADRYIFQQTEKARSNPTHIGTGGTPFMVYLTKHLEETKQMIR